MLQPSSVTHAVASTLPRPHTSAYPLQGSKPEQGEELASRLLSSWLLQKLIKRALLGCLSLLLAVSLASERRPLEKDALGFEIEDSLLGSYPESFLSNELNALPSSFAF